MFLDNKYSKWYFNIISNASQRLVLSGYFEKHHIIPKSLGGSNEAENLVNLTAREHFICHMLLPKMVIDINHKRKMAYAAWQLSNRLANKTEITVHSRTYEMLKIQLSVLYTGRKRAPFSDKAKANMSAAAKTRKNAEMTEERLEKLRMISKTRKKTPMSDHQKQRISESVKGKPLSDDHREKIKKAKIGQSQTEETKRKISESKRNEPLITCPHCGFSGRGGNMKRYHLDKCKLRDE